MMVAAETKAEANRSTREEEDSRRIGVLRRKTDVEKNREEPMKWARAIAIVVPLKNNTQLSKAEDRTKIHGRSRCN